MSDATPGDRVDAAIAAATQAVADLREDLALVIPEVGATINARIDAIQARIDDVAAALAERLAE